MLVVNQVNCLMLLQIFTGSILEHVENTLELVCHFMYSQF